MTTVIFLLLGGALTGGGIWLKWFLMRQDRHDHYRHAAIERRLETHQKAFALTFEMQKSASPEKFEMIFNKCQHWWNENNFYLEPHSRRMFHNCYWELLAFQDKTTESSNIERRMNFFKIILPGTRKTITEEIGYVWQQENPGNSQPLP